jgi:hypothetical protein
LWFMLPLSFIPNFLQSFFPFSTVWDLKMVSLSFLIHGETQVHNTIWPGSLFTRFVNFCANTNAVPVRYRLP